MKTLSEILELAMPSFIRRAENLGNGYMCFRVEDLRRCECISMEEEYKTRKAIEKKIGYKSKLKEYLASKGRKTTALAQIRFYRKWIKELKAQGL